MRSLVVLGLGLLALGLGTWGYSIDPHNLSFGDSLYSAIQLFGFGGADLTSPGWQLQVARFLAPAIVGVAAVRGLVALSREQLRLLGFRLLRRNHLVVAGLGEMGFRLATVFHDAGARVIALDRDPANPSLVGCRERGIGTLAGDATDPGFLDKARVGRASLLIAACGDDGVNLDAAAAGRVLAQGRRRGVLTAIAHMDDRALWRALEARAISDAPSPTFRLELFNTFETASRLLLESHPPFPPEPPAEPRVLVSGDDALAESLVVNIVRLWQTGTAGGKLHLTLAGPAAEVARRRLLDRYPAIEPLCELTAWDVELVSSSVRHDPRILEADAIYVALADEATGLAAAMLLASSDRDPGVAPVVLAVADEHAGAASVISTDARDAERIEVFGVLSRALAPSLVLRGLTETLARAMHENYYRQEAARGITPEVNESAVPWAELPESLKESNRRFADGIGEKLRAVGCVVVPTPLVDLEDSLVEFTAEEIERLAKLEHDRWCADQLRDGWTRGDVQDPARKIHNFIVEWDELPEAEREKDREAMGELPRMLAGAGFELHRVRELRRPR